MSLFPVFENSLYHFIHFIKCDWEHTLFPCIGEIEHSLWAAKDVRFKASKACVATYLRVLNLGGRLVRSSLLHSWTRNSVTYLHSKIDERNTQWKCLAGEDLSVLSLKDGPLNLNKGGLSAISHSSRTVNRFYQSHTSYFTLSPS